MIHTKLATLPRATRPVALPGGGTVHVRDLTIGELRRIDRHLDAPDPSQDQTEAKILFALLVAASALCDPDGTPLFADPFAHLGDVENLTPSQLAAVTAVAIPSKADAKN